MLNKCEKPKFELQPCIVIEWNILIEGAFYIFCQSCVDYFFLNGSLAIFVALLGAALWHLPCRVMFGGFCKFLWFKIFFLQIFKNHNSKTVFARELKFWENVHPTPCVICHMSPVTCHLPCVTCHMWYSICLFFYLKKMQSDGVRWWRVCYQRDLPLFSLPLIKYFLIKCLAVALYKVEVQM